MGWGVGADLAADARAGVAPLAQDPVRNTVPASVLAARLDGTVPPDGIWTAWLSDRGAVSAVALCTPPRGLLHTDLPPGTAATLAAVAPERLPGASGPTPDVTAFTQAYGARRGGRPVLDHLV